MMWNTNRSVILSCICTKIVILMSILFLCTAPFWVKLYIQYTYTEVDMMKPLLCTIYITGIVAMILLFCLNQLLANIKNNNIFTFKNVSLLRIISWCCFATALILLLSGLYYILFLFGAIGAGFFGLILRVVKNVIEQAVIIKTENDFTI